MKFTGTYKSDKEFTNYVHEHLACSLIYPKLDWIIQDINTNMLNNIDTNNAIDYLAIDKKAMKTVTIQERFREQQYGRYSDFTIRYKRDYNQHEERKLSEYFKLDADYFVYGIIDQDKINVKKATGFLKYCVIDVNKIKEFIDLGKIVIRENSKMKRCFMEENRLICPVVENLDYSSSFIPIDIALLDKFYKNEDIVILQEGFY